MSHKILFFATILFFSFSCNSKEVYYQFKEVDGNQWSRCDTLYFDIDSSFIDVNKQYSLSLESINNTDYLYQNLWLYVYDDFEGSAYKKYEKQYILSDSLGKWLGDGFGSIYQLSLPYRNKIKFSEKRNYHLKIIHGMIDEPLDGIEKIGVKLLPNTD